ncbi:hypothetical protein GDO78_017696 [Eleutherodactylus coqui]|uniref:Uncharacterized protein n=1 Tax=Eleutherodactylus coqui TaxID=57060 RepID=A0A8J6BL84_ELECQ|nr:hypothetical protein GDO78_017696 [Eleutherodactylus coqui]
MNRHHFVSVCCINSVISRIAAYIHTNLMLLVTSCSAPCCRRPLPHIIMSSNHLCSVYIIVCLLVFCFLCIQKAADTKCTNKAPVMMSSVAVICDPHRSHEAT